MNPLCLAYSFSGRFKTISLPSRRGQRLALSLAGYQSAFPRLSRERRSTGNEVDALLNIHASSNFLLIPEMFCGLGYCNRNFILPLGSPKVRTTLAGVTTSESQLERWIVFLQSRIFSAADAFGDDVGQRLPAVLKKVLYLKNIIIISIHLCSQIEWSLNDFSTRLFVVSLSDPETLTFEHRTV